MIRLRAMRRNVQLVQPSPQGDTTREISVAAYDRVVEMQGQALKAEHAQGNIVVYDQVSGAPRIVGHNVAMQHDLRKVVSYCTACNHTSATSAEIRAHIDNVAKKAESHRNAQPMDMVTAQGAGSRCSACDATFISRPSAVHEHIREAIAAGRAHLHPEVRSTQQFGLVPPVVVPGNGTVSHENGTVPHTNGTTPVASQEGWRPQRRRRHRNRGRKEVRA